MTRQEACEKILETYGEENQRKILIEEMGELIQAIIKVERYGDSYRDAYISELADVTIMIKQMVIALSEIEQKAYEDEIDEKLGRQLGRIWRDERFGGL